MRTVTIPNDYNPFRLEVNGRIYSYKAGTTQSVPDEVAELIDMYNQSKPVPKQNSIIDHGLDFQKTDADKVLKVNQEGTDVEWAEGGGGGGSMLVHVDLTFDGASIASAHLDKTWKEIHDALLAGKTVSFLYVCEEDGYIVSFSLKEMGFEDGDGYFIEFANGDGVVYNTDVFYTDSEDGYPGYVDVG